MFSVEKRTVYIARRGTDQNEGAWAGVPDGVGFKSFITSPGEAVIDQASIAGQASYPIQLSARAATTDGPVTAIAIAPDSPVESCDLHIGQLGGESVHRISPGAPYIGRIYGDAFVRVAPVRSIPLLYSDGVSWLSAVNARLALSFWDMDSNSDTTNPTVGGGVVIAPSIPLRLEVYRGDVSALPLARAPYSASWVWRIPVGGTPTFQGLYVIVDGRRRFRVVASGNAASTIQIFGVESLKIENPTALTRYDTAAFDEICAPTALLGPRMIDNPTPGVAPFIYDNNGTMNPYFALYIRIEGAASNRGCVDVRAWDS